jgi:hypothetical protein
VPGQDDGLLQQVSSQMCVLYCANVLQYGLKTYLWVSFVQLPISSLESLKVTGVIAVLLV